MTVLKRHRVAWSGSSVIGPGLSTFYVKPDSTVGEADDIEAFFNAIKALFSTGVTWTIESSGDLIEDTTGALAGSWSDPGTGGTVTGTSAQNYVLGAGARVVWGTSGIFKNRRVKGATFLCPLIIDAFSGNQALADTPRATMQTAAAALLTAVPELCVWSRPQPGFPGESHLVTSTSVPDKVSWLRSRRT